MESAEMNAHARPGKLHSIRHSAMITGLASCLVLFFLSVSLEAKRRPKPWPEINLSTLPSIVGMSNSWAFEINHRSPAYLSDLDKMHVSFGYGFGRNENNFSPLTGSQTKRYGYDFYRGIDYSINELKLDIYSHLGKTTFGSLWVTYGRDRDRDSKKPFLISTPTRLVLKTAYAMKLKENLTAGFSGSISNYPISYLFALQPSDAFVSDSQVVLRAGDGENIVGEFDLLYRTRANLDFIVGGIFQSLRTKFDPPDPPAGANYRDTAIVKEYVYSGAPKFIVKKTFKSGGFLRSGGVFYFNLFDYQYQGGSRFDYPSQAYPSYRSQSFASLVPDWKFYIDGARALGNSGTLYSNLEFSGYPNRLKRLDTDFVPVNLSLAQKDNLFSILWEANVTSRLTRIMHFAAGVKVRYFDDGYENVAFIPEDGGSVYQLLDSRSVFPSLSFGTTTRFYRNLWWSVRVPDLRLYKSDKLGSAILFENKSYIETEVLFLGI